MIVGLGINLLALGCVLANKALIAARVRARPDGWRRVVGAGLRGEPAKFALSAFGLSVPGATVGAPAFNADTARQLARFLETEPEARYRLRHGYRLTTRHATERVDLVVQHFDAAGALARVESILAPGTADATDPVTRDKVHAAVATAYNRTRHLPEAQRPARLRAAVRAETSGEAVRYAERVLGACCVSFEPPPAEPHDRFAPPEFRARRCLGYGLLTFVLRPAPATGTADVWVLAHHAGTDGAPLQELVSRLERAWPATPVAFPDPDTATVIGPRPCFVAGEREAYESVSFHDFAPLLDLRKRLNAKFAAEMEGDIPFACLLLWCLAREPEFAGTKFASTVDVPAAGGSERDADFVCLKPAAFGSDDAGLVDYARAFNRLIAAARARSGPTREVCRFAEMMPAWVHRLWLERSPALVDETFGRVALSVLRDAKVFLGPLADLAFPGGLIAVGGVGLPTASGRTVGIVTVKGDRTAAAGYPAVFRRVLERCRAV